MAEAIRDGLRLEAIAADIAGDGDTALELLSVNPYDIAVLDRDVPGPSGDEIARRIVASGSGMPILMLTAADGLDHKSSGFGLGADDYLTKPFELQELVLRLRALDRRRAHRRPPGLPHARRRLAARGRVGVPESCETRGAHSRAQLRASRAARIRSDRRHRAGFPARVRSRGRVVSRGPDARPPDAHHKRHTHRR